MNLVLPRNRNVMPPEYRAVLLSDPCVYCGERRSHELDHIRAKSHGGSDGWENRAPCCVTCNRMKANYSMMWMLWRFNEARQGRIGLVPIGFRLMRRNGRVVQVPVGFRIEYLIGRFLPENR